jgi:hypothetical protein
MLMFSMIVFAGISLAMMLASQVPIIANGINSVLGLPETAQEGKPDRTTHLFFLLFCYTSPLLMAMLVSFVQMFLSWERKQFNKNVETAEDAF